MNNKQQAVAELKRFAVQMRGIMALADDLDQLGAMEQTQADLKDKADKLSNEIKAEEKRLADAKAKADEAEKAAKEREAEAKKQYDLTVEANTKTANKLLAEATAEASSDSSKSMVTTTCER